MNPYLWNIVLSYCNGHNETVELIKFIDDDSKITELHYGGDIEDLSRFKNLRVLKRSYGITDLGPLRGMPLQKLDLRYFQGDLEALRGMPLQVLYLNWFQGDLGPLRGMPLQELYLYSFHGDLGPLRGMPLQVLYAALGCIDGDGLADIIRPA